MEMGMGTRSRTYPPNPRALAGNGHRLDHAKACALLPHVRHDVVELLVIL
jgi:hypothetical protein